MVIMELWKIDNQSVTTIVLLTNWGYHLLNIELNYSPLIDGSLRALQKTRWSEDQHLSKDNLS